MASNHIRTFEYTTKLEGNRFVRRIPGRMMKRVKQGSPNLERRRRKSNTGKGNLSSYSLAPGNLGSTNNNFSRSITTVPTGAPFGLRTNFLSVMATGTFFALFILL